MRRGEQMQRSNPMMGSQEKHPDKGLSQLCEICAYEYGYYVYIYIYIYIYIYMYR